MVYRYGSVEWGVLKNNHDSPWMGFVIGQVVDFDRIKVCAVLSNKSSQRSGTRNVLPLNSAVRPNMGVTDSDLNRSFSKLLEGVFVSALLLSGLLFAECSVKYVGKNYPGLNLPETDFGTAIFRSTSSKVLGGLLTHLRQVAVLCKVDGQRIDMNPETPSVKELLGKHSL